MQTNILRGALILFLTFCFSRGAFSQVPSGFNFQAVIRDANGDILANESVGLRFKLWLNIQFLGDVTIYSETQLTTTNEFGLVNVVIGDGTVVTGTWTNISWSSTLNLRTEVNLGNGYIDMGTQPLQSVPYAMRAEDVIGGAWKRNGNADTDTTMNFIGTTDNEPVIFKVDGEATMMMETDLNTSYNDFIIRGHTPTLNFLGADNSSSAMGIWDGYTNIIDFHGIALETIDGKILFNPWGYLGIGSFYADPDENPYVPMTRLHVSGGSDASLSSHGYFVLGQIASTNIVMDNNEIIARNNGAASDLFLNTTDGGVVIGSGSSTSHHLLVNGTAAKPGGGSWAATSDARLKENVQPFTQGLDEVMKIAPVTYHYISQTGHDVSVEHVGVIAQELKEISPAMVQTVEMEMADGTKGNYLCIDPSAFTYMLINAVQELKSENVQLKNSIDELHRDNAERNTDFETRLKDLELRLLNNR